MKEVVVTGLKALRPPARGADTDEMVAWHWRVAVITGGCLVALAFHIALACGFLTALHPGFAKASDLYALQQEWRESREAELEAKILDAKEKQCMANDGALRRLYTDSLQKLMVSYEKVSRRKYPVPDCKDFGV